MLVPYRKSCRSYLGISEYKEAGPITPINKQPITHEEWAENFAHETTKACVKKQRLNCLKLKNLNSSKLYSTSCPLWKAIEFTRNSSLSIKILHITATKVRI